MVIAYTMETLLLFQLRLWFHVTFFLAIFVAAMPSAGVGDTISKVSTTRYDLESCAVGGDVACERGMRYLLYDTTFYEGFNLRVNAYMRMANLLRVLNLEPGQNWTLVLPPWSEMRHWMNRHIAQRSIPWAKFFDIDGIREYIPAIEHAEFIEQTGGQIIDQVYYLQDYVGGWDFWKNPNYEVKMDVEKCHQNTGFRKNEEGLWKFWFWGFTKTAARNFNCLSVQSEAANMRHFLIKRTKGRSVAFFHAEQLLHGVYGEWTPQWWSARRSLRYAKRLRDLGNEFRAKYLDSTDVNDGTVWEQSWKNMRRNHGEARGGPYAALHLRRGDYEIEYKDVIPSLKSSAQQIEKVMKLYKLKTLFVATDAKDEQYKLFKKYLKHLKVLRFEYNETLLQEVMDGGIAIIDQWICAHARVFMGSFRSTFSYRIQEEREIMGFLTSTTYLQLCPEHELDCIHKSQWQIVYD